MFPRDETAYGLPADYSDDSGETPADAHAEFMWASEAGLFAPAMFGFARGGVGASVEKGTNEAFYG